MFLAHRLIFLSTFLNNRWEQHSLCQHHYPEPCSQDSSVALNFASERSTHWLDISREFGCSSTWVRQISLTLRVLLVSPSFRICWLLSHNDGRNDGTDKRIILERNRKPPAKAQDVYWSLHPRIAISISHHASCRKCCACLNGVRQVNLMICFSCIMIKYANSRGEYEIKDQVLR